jgi:glycosyltransferase involved in cell wall biosynthesis
VLKSEPPLLVFADDWGRHPSSCQHLVRHLLPRRSVVWVNTIGTRPPRLDMATMRRGWGKARHWLRSTPMPGTPDDVAPRVLNPRMWPWVSSAFARGLNRRLLAKQLLPAIRALPAAPVAVTALPIVADLIGVLPVARWVYYCVDDLSLWPGLDGVALRRLEDHLVGRVDEIVAVSEPLRDRLAAATGRPVRLLTHGVDLEHWSNDSVASIPALDGLERPLMVFWGVVDRRMDVEFVRRLAADLDRGTIVLVGPHNDPDPALLRLPRVTSTGPLPFEHLSRLAREATVLIMPYADLPVTRAMQPLKLKEYLATGKPVVTRALPATHAWADALDSADTPEAFSAVVRQRLATSLPADHRAARARLSGESWAAKAKVFERWISPRRPAPALAGVAVP